MKMLSVILLISSMPAFGQDVWKLLADQRGKAKVEVTKPTGPKPAVVTKEDVRPSQKKTECKQDENTSLPMSLVLGLLQKSPTHLQFEHDPRSGKLKVKTGGMISNCSSMLQWTLQPKSIDGNKTYALQLQFKDGENCETKDGKKSCSYEVVKIGQKPKPYINKTYSPNISGLEQCLKDTGVVTKDGINEDAMLTEKELESFSGVTSTGDLLLESVGRELPKTEAAYGSDFVLVDGCSKYEQVAENSIRLYSEEDEKEIAYKQDLDNCKTFKDVADFVEKNQIMSDEVFKIISPIIESAAKESAAKITKGKYTDEDVKVLAMFDKYVATPLMEKARRIYDESLELEGEEKKKKQEELKVVLKKVVAYQKEPFITQPILDKLEANGKFDGAQTVHGLKMRLYTHSQLGSKIKGVVHTSEMVVEAGDAYIEAYAEGLEEKKEKYAVAVGESEGHSETYYTYAANLREDVIERTKNYQLSIAVEAACISHPQDMAAQQRCAASYGMTCDRLCKNEGGRYCYGTFVYNKQRCIEDGQIAIQDLSEELEFYNKVDAERIAEYETEAQTWEQLEAKGRAHLAGDKEDKKDKKTAKKNKTSPDRRTANADDDVPTQNPYGSFGQNQQMNNMMPGYQNNMFTQQNPYQQYMYGTSQGSNFGFNGSFQMGSQFGNQNFGNQYGSQFGGQQFPMGPSQFPMGASMGGQPGGMMMGQNPYGSFAGGQGAGMSNMGQQGYWGNPQQAYGTYPMSNSSFFQYGI